VCAGVEFEEFFSIPRGRNRPRRSDWQPPPTASRAAQGFRHRPQRTVHRQGSTAHAGAEANAEQSLHVFVQQSGQIAASPGCGREFLWIWRQGHIRIRTEGIEKLLKTGERGKLSGWNAMTIPTPACPIIVKETSSSFTATSPALPPVEFMSDLPDFWYRFFRCRRPHHLWRTPHWARLVSGIFRQNAAETCPPGRFLTSTVPQLL